jgi:hypothetical protein
MLNLHKRAQRPFFGLFLGSVSTSQLFSTVHLILTVEMIRAANKYHPTLPCAPATLAVSLILQSALLLPQAAASSSTPPSRSPLYTAHTATPKPIRAPTSPHLCYPLLVGPTGGAGVGPGWPHGACWCTARRPPGCGASAGLGWAPSSARPGSAGLGRRPPRRGAREPVSSAQGRWTPRLDV